MLNIRMNLVNDFEEYILGEIKKTQLGGFSFEEYDDWEKEEILRKNQQIIELQKTGTDTTQIKESLKPDKLKNEYRRHLVYTYGNLLERIIPVKPRKILYTSDFQRLPEYEEGLCFLEEKIRSGANLLPHMSRQIFDSMSKDGLLYDFNIQHLHLGTKPDAKHPEMIEGRKKVLYCVVDDETVYFLVIEDHNHWGDIDLIRLIKNNFPYLLKPFEMNVHSLSSHLSEEDRVKLRKAGINTPIEVDGKCYMSPGWGVNTMGTSINAVFEMDCYYRHYRSVEENFRQFMNENEEEILNVLSSKNEFNLVMVNISPVILIDKGNGIIINLELNGDQIHRIGIAQEEITD